MGIGYIPCSKYSGYLRTWTITIGNNIPHFIRVDIILEYIRIRFMTDSQEETVNRQIVTFFIRFTPASYKVYAFYAIIPIQTDINTFNSTTRSCIIFDARKKGLRTIKYTLDASPAR